MMSPHARAEINTDGQLCARVRDGDPLALGVLFDRYRGAVLKCLLRTRIVRHNQPAEEMLSFAYPVAEAVFRSYRPDRGSSLLTFTMRFLPMHLLKAWRSERETVRVPLTARAAGVSTRTVPIASERQPGAVFIDDLGRVEPEPDRLTGAELDRLLGTLDPRDRRILEDRARGRILADIAADLGISKQRVGQLEAAALATLRQRLQGTAA